VCTTFATCRSSTIPVAIAVVAIERQRSFVKSGPGVRIPPSAPGLTNMGIAFTIPFVMSYTRTGLHTKTV
jgi:hypothetical protein